MGDDPKKSAVELATGTAQQFMKLYYERMDTNRHKIGKIYLDNATMSWNGTKQEGVQGVQSFLLEKVPSSEHELHSLDAHPVMDFAVDGQTTVIVQAAGNVKYPSQKPNNSHKTLFLLHKRMNVYRNGTRKPTFVTFTFCSLWEQLRNITSKTLLPNYDDIIICINLVDQMVHLLQLEILEEQLGYPCLQLIMKENIPAHILGTSRMPVHIDLQEKLQLHLLRLYLTIFEKPSIFESFLPCESISKPLFELLSELDENNNNNNINDAMNQNLNFSSKNCVNDLQVINLMKSDSTKISKNSVMPFRFLTKFIHNDKWIGQQARDAMLGCVSLSERVPDLDYYISEYTDFCPVLATGLSALYSSLPRRFSLGNDSCSLTDADIVAHSPLRSFFTNVLDLVHMVFLVPVLGPSLTQSYDEELISATAYCDLCIRATNSHLLGLFLKFLFTSNIEEIPIIDILTQRLQVKNKLSLVTLKLFYSLIDLNCEDVQFWLILKYLVPLSHILPPHRACIIQPDLHSRASEKFLALVPICCQRENSEEQDMNQSRKRSIRLPCCCYTYYLHDARLSVRYNLERTKFWVFPYDGVNPSVKGCNNSYSQECVAEGRRIRYNSILSQSQPNLKKLEQDESKFSRSLDNFTYSYDNWDYSKKEVVKDEEIPVKVLGPFLETLFDRVESMVSNGLTANLLITSIISRLAAYPQPLLKTILLHPDPIFQPWVRNLFKSIMTLKQHIDDTMPSLEGSDEALIEARRYLNNRIHSVDSDNSSLKKSQEIKPRRSLSNTFSSHFSEENPNLVILNYEVQNYAMTAIIMEDWLKELSAIAHEQSVLQKELSFQFDMARTVMLCPRGYYWSFLSKRAYILGIESSCDDTGAALLDSNGKVLGESLRIQSSSRFGGVIPSIAMGRHARALPQVVDTAMGSTSFSSLRAIAISNQPGLKGLKSKSIEMASGLSQRDQVSDFCAIQLMTDRKLVVSGGVACNKTLRSYIDKIASTYGYDTYYPPPQYCTDNGLMIAWNGIEKMRAGWEMVQPKNALSIQPLPRGGSSTKPWLPKDDTG
ncbi:unnamed protein product [Lepeophtheirus salmonis]|uniref:N(6)-L-threonylcarbamoyladenine synthase n=1 Tax=Lepeophtheirus salmonis TaxID=72036 RepID=A0A7R8CZQ6_LEPSM|nr:unnamed protein product [Lepeophtheirus salmonis]CAF2976631.1 unnamed protein product [Lepeophtheirus salmonis]